MLRTVWIVVTVTAVVLVDQPLVGMGLSDNGQADAQCPNIDPKIFKQIMAVAEEQIEGAHGYPAAVLAVSRWCKTQEPPVELNSEQRKCWLKEVKAKAAQYEAKQGHREPPPRMSLADLDPTTRRYVEAAQTTRSRVIADRRRNLEAARQVRDATARGRRSPRNGSSYRPSAKTIRIWKQQAADKIRHCEAALLRAESASYKPNLSIRAKGIGHFPTYRGQAAGVRILQILSESEMHVESWDQILAVKGVPTDGLVDGRYVSLPGVFEITGTKTYATAIGGTNTVFVAEPAEVDFAAASKWSIDNRHP